MGVCNRCKVQTEGKSKLCPTCRAGGKKRAAGARAVTRISDEGRFGDVGASVAAAVNALVDRKLMLFEGQLDTIVEAKIGKSLQALAVALNAAAKG